MAPRAAKRIHPSQHVAGANPRGLRAVWCTCGQPILQGLDEDACAMIVRADPTPISIAGEAMARIDGRNTYTLQKINGTFQLMRRNRHTIVSRPPASKIWCGLIDVLAEHRCGTDPLPSLPTVHPAPTYDLEAFDDACPF